MPRYKLIVEYDGGGFVGWQRQEIGISVQQALESAVAGFCDEKVTVQAAGRTDAGVHALGQTVHMDLTKSWSPDVVRDAVNHYLRPAAISVLEVTPVGSDFDARFSARARSYLYRIVNRKVPLTLERGRAWQVPPPLDAEAMHAAAQCLVGHHDFSSFRASACQSASALKTLDQLTVERNGEAIYIAARARSFLHHQVRNMVGSLKLVGEGKWRGEDVGRALAARDRRAAGPTAPAEGLYLVEVRY